MSIATLLWALCAATNATAADPCAELDALIAEVYVFRPAELSREERQAAAEGMDRVWSLVQAAPDALAPCLRAALEREDADPWFRFDGSALLVAVEPSHESEALKARLWTDVDFEDVDLRYWVESMARLGLAGHDVSAAAERWSRAGREYFVPEHGLHRVDARQGTFMLLGSMDEALATPALVRMVETPEHPFGPRAFSLLSLQGTPAAWRALREVDLDAHPAGLAGVRDTLSASGPGRPLDEPAETRTREQLVAALDSVLAGESRDPQAGLSASDWMLNALAELTADDLEPLRQLRRRRATSSSDEMLSDYMRSSIVIQALSWEPPSDER